jgi:N-acetylglutamate synthase-like GNAT family acetyltransferase
VPPEFRGMGIASELCKRIEYEALRLGYLNLYLFTKDQMSLYSRMGWETMSVEEYKGMNVTIMKKEISK